MKKIIIFALIAVGVFQLHKNGHLDALSAEFSSQERLEEQLGKKIMELDLHQKAMNQAQANAPSCGGVQMQVVFCDKTTSRVRQLEAEIADLRKRIAQKKG